MGALEPVRASRELAVVAARLEEAERLRRTTEGFPDPFFGREFPGKTWFDDLSELPESDPLRAPLLRVVHRLIDERVEWPFTELETRAERRSPRRLQRPIEGEFTWREMGLRALVADDALGPALLDARSRFDGEIGAHRFETAARRVEVARRLGLAHPDRLTGPLEDEKELEKLARRFLSRTRPLAEGLGIQGPFDFLRVARALEAADGWPARLALPTLVELFGRERFRSVRSSPVVLPARLVPASFLLAASRLGLAWFEGLAPTDLPFVVARDVERLAATREGIGWALVLSQRPFLRRRLGLGARAVETYTRTLSLSLLVEARKRAARVLVREAAFRGRSEIERLSEELGVELFGVPLAPFSLLAHLSIGRGTPVDFAAFGLALERHSRLVETHDEDYAFAPRAMEEMRDEAALPPFFRVSPSEIESGFASFERNLARLV